MSCHLTSYTPHKTLLKATNFCRKYGIIDKHITYLIIYNYSF